MKEKFMYFLIVLILLTGCTSVEKNVPMKNPAKGYPDVKFAVASDLHYYDSSLGTTGSAFRNYIENDRKMLAESTDVNKKLAELISEENVDFVLISGDLTKDGERINHEKTALLLSEIEKSGKKVYVVPGNHDINNPDAVSFNGDKKTPVKSVSPSEFSGNYSDFGYKEAISRDTHSLSYAVEPKSELIVMGIDSCQYDDNKNHPVTAGRIKKETLEWISGIALKAKSENKRIIAFMHHGIVEHYPNNKEFYPEYILENYGEAGRLFAANGINLVFTGHYHAQDATVRTFENGYVLDIETGSPMTFPVPFRLISIESNTLNVSTKYIKEIDTIPDFYRYADEFTFQGSIKLFDSGLKKFGANDSDTLIVSPQGAKAYTTHLNGDENKPDDILNLEGVGLLTGLIIGTKKGMIDGWYTDLPPSDNNFKFDLLNAIEIK